MKITQNQHRYKGITSVITALVVTLWSHGLFAQTSDWWFDIEVLIYNRLDNSPSSPEVFTPQAVDYSQRAAVDLLTPYLQPDLSRLAQNLSFCLPEPQFETQVEYESSLPSFAWEEEQKQLQQVLKTVAQQSAEEFIQQTNQWESPSLSEQTCGSKSNIQPYWFTQTMPSSGYLDLPQTPQIIDGVGNESSIGPYLLPRSQFAFKTLFRDLTRSKNQRPLLHLAWRQPVPFGRSKAPYFRLFAGENYTPAPQLDTDLQDKPLAVESDEIEQTTDVFRLIEQAMQAPVPEPDSIFAAEEETVRESSIEQVWQLDGLFKVYLQRIGRVPYLHIDSELQYQTPKESDELTADAELKVASFKQLRRVISKQIHYFDHPQFGMVVQIRRYRKPIEADE